MIEGYRISDQQHELDFNVIHHYLSQSYWAEGIPRHTLRKAIENSLCFGVYTNSGEQVGFARLVTDRATFAYLADVFILTGHRGRGLSRWLMKVILAHPDSQGLRRMVLVTRDAHGLYEKFGFTTLNSPQGYMELWQPEIYQ